MMTNQKRLQDIDARLDELEAEAQRLRWERGERSRAASGTKRVRLRPEIQAFLTWAEVNGFVLDQHSLPPGDPSNPFTHDETRLAFEAFCAGRESIRTEPAMPLFGGIDP